MRLKGRAFSFVRYITGNTPWDSDEPRPTLISFLEETNLPPGKILDLGCGTGSNLIALAGLGWRGSGVDHVSQPLIKARRKARKAEVAERIRFIRGDVRRLDRLHLDPPYDMVLDFGCGHVLGDEAFIPYLANVSRLIRAGGWFILFAYLPSAQRTTAYLDRDFVLHHASAFFALVRWEEEDRRGLPVCWYFLKRKDQIGGGL